MLNFYSKLSQFFPVNSKFSSKNHFDDTFDDLCIEKGIRLRPIVQVYYIIIYFGNPPEQDFTGTKHARTNTLTLYTNTNIICRRRTGTRGYGGGGRGKAATYNEGRRRMLTLRTYTGTRTECERHSYNIIYIYYTLSPPGPRRIEWLLCFFFFHFSLPINAYPSLRLGRRTELGQHFSHRTPFSYNITILYIRVITYMVSASFFFLYRGKRAFIYLHDSQCPPPAHMCFPRFHR